jgi:serpin B
MFFLLILGNCKTVDNSEEDPETLAAMVKLIESESNSEFGIDLFKTLVVNDPSDNIFISPISVSMALGMTMNGATGNTAYEMQNTLGFSDMTQEEINMGYKSLMRELQDADDQVEFDIANSVWAKEPLSMKDEFETTIEEYFEAETASLDFSDPKTLDRINAWVADHTNQRITKIINEIKPEDVMFLINAVYFNGNWKYKFDPEDTQTSPFYLDETSTVDAEMMVQMTDVHYYIDNTVTMIDLPYGNEAYSMQLMMPTQSNYSLETFIEKHISASNLTQWNSQLEVGECTISIPKIKIEYKRELKQDLRSLGMNQVFSPGGAELYNLFEGIDNDIFLSAVSHKTFLKVAEEGTEAAAVTNGTIGAGSYVPPSRITLFKPLLRSIFLLQI